MAVVSLIPSFNAGELSPLIHLRSDLEKYRSGCRTLRNMLISPYGGAKRREGFEWVTTLPGRGLLFPFQAGADLGYVLAFTDKQLRIFRNGQVVQSGGTDYVVASPYGIDDISAIQLAQLNEIAYLVHPNFPVHRLARLSESNWELAPVEFDFPPMREENLQRKRTLKTLSAGASGDEITLKSSHSIFSGANVGSFFVLSHERDMDQVTVELAATTGNNGVTSAPLIVQGAWNITTRGTWNGTFTVLRSTDGGATKVPIRQFTSASDSNFTAGGVEKERVLLYLKWEHGGAGSSNQRAILEASGNFIRGLVKVISVTSEKEARVVVINAVEKGSTSYWRESAWSARRGFPRTVTAHEQRVVYGGSKSDKQTLWASAVDDYQNFEPGVEDSDSWTHTFASDQQNDIRWMISQKSLLVGTSGDEWVISATKEEAIITPTNVRARRHSGNGSTKLKPCMLNDSVLFVQRGGRKLREMAYSAEADGYRSADLTILAEHVTGDGIVDMALQPQPDSVLWCVTAGGELIGLTYEKGQDVVGWHRHTTGVEGDAFLSVSVRKVSGQKDEVWALIRRQIAGGEVFTVERLKSGGFFLYDRWDMLFPSSDGLPSWSVLFDESPQPPWETKNVEYTAGDVCTADDFNDVPFDDGVSNIAFAVRSFSTGPGYAYGVRSRLWYAPPFADDVDWVVAIPWDNTTSGLTYLETLPVYVGGTIYACIADHDPYALAGTADPGTGSGWATYWVAVQPMPGTIPNFVGSGAYQIDDVVSSGGINYKCIGIHVPAADNEPGVGVSWEFYWEPIRSMYHQGDRIQMSEVVYEALSDHYPEEATAPPTGADWEDYWSIPQGSYAAGALVSADGKNYVCKLNHVPTSASRPGVGAGWRTYWLLRTTENLLFYVDGGVTQQGVTLTEMTGLDHLEGRMVQVVANRALLNPRQVIGGKVRFNLPTDPTPPTFTDITVGLPYESLLEPMALEVGMQNGSSVSREKRIHELVVYFRESYGCRAGATMTGDFDRLAFFDTGEVDGLKLFTGSIVHKLDSRHVADSSFILKQDMPLPMHVVAIVPKFNVYGDNG